jgi:hypothetical protein
LPQAPELRSSHISFSVIDGKVQLDNFQSEVPCKIIFLAVNHNVVKQPTMQLQPGDRIVLWGGSKCKGITNDLYSRQDVEIGRELIIHISGSVLPNLNALFYLFSFYSLYIVPFDCKIKPSSNQHL